MLYTSYIIDTGYSGRCTAVSYTHLNNIDFCSFVVNWNVLWKDSYPSFAFQVIIIQYQFTICPVSYTHLCRLRAEKIAKIPVPDVKVQGCEENADLLIVGFGGT